MIQAEPFGGKHAAAKLNQNNLHGKGEDPDPDEHRVVHNAVKDIPLIVDLASIELIEKLWERGKRILSKTQMREKRKSEEKHLNTL